MVLLVAQTGFKASFLRWTVCVARGSRYVRAVHSDTSAVVRLSQHYNPTIRAEAVSREQVESVALLLRGGYVRQSASGFFTLLPNGLRVVRKIERIVDEEMRQIGASRLEMPAVLTSTLWHKSGRFDAMGSELYKLKDRRGTEFVLGPTYEEEITKLIGDDLQSWRQLPIKVYQITNKFRDEPRPRSGMLRTRGFLMKDLYTFDATLEEAKITYDQVCSAYERIMTRLFGQKGQGWRTADADTGAMGGKLSQEYQVPDELGEDELLVCNNCRYSANSEKAVSLPVRSRMPIDADEVNVTLHGLSDPSAHGCTMTAVLSSSGRQINQTKLTHHLKSMDSTELSQIYPTDGATVWDWKDRPEGPLVRFDRIRVLLDHECTALDPEEIQTLLLQAVEAYGSPSGMASPVRQEGSPTLQDYFSAQFASANEALPVEIVDIRLAEHGDPCAMCHKGLLDGVKTVEVGHTFLLGSRYSEALGYKIAQKDHGAASEAFQMGCYGIGISRIFGVLAQRATRSFSPVQGAQNVKSGLAWSPDVAPFRALILPLNAQDETQAQAAKLIIQALQSGLSSSSEGRADAFDISEAIEASEIALDDRADVSFGVKLKEADLMGYPIIVLLGKHFQKTGEVELRVRSQDGQQSTVHVSLAHVSLASFSSSS